MSVQSLIGRTHRMQLMASELAPRLEAIAMSGSMLEHISPGRNEYLAQLQQEAAERAKAFGELAIEHAYDLRETPLKDLKDVKDVKFAGAWRAARMEPPPESDWLLIDRAAIFLLEYGQSLRDWEFGNPDWRKWTRAGLLVTALTSAVLAATTVAMVLSGGVAAVNVMPLVVAYAGAQIAAAIAAVADILAP